VLEKACIYFDASWRRELREAKYAAVALPFGPRPHWSEKPMTPERLRTLRLIAYRSGFDWIEPERPFHATEAETLAYGLAVSLGRELLRDGRVERVVLYGDSRYLLRNLRSQCPFSLRWLPREQNRVAHSFANWSCGGGLVLPKNFTLPHERV
jgi:hypothetical protein